MAGLFNLRRKILILRSAQFLGQFRHCVEQVRNQTEIRNLEDRRFFVFVDRHDDFRVLHAREVLDRTRDADGDVQVRGDDLTGLAHLPVDRLIARVDGGARGTNSRAQLVGLTFDQFEVLF